jgi:hypothetical protein
MNNTAKKFLISKYRIAEIPYENVSMFKQMPILKGEYVIPSHLISFNDINYKYDYSAGVHMFLDDQILDRIWKNPIHYIDKLKNYHCVFTPDFSLLLNMYEPVISWNSYRSKHIGVLMQKNNIKVIPTISWAGRNTYDACFDGYPRNSVVAVSSVGVMKKKLSLPYFMEGFREMLRRLSPSTIIFYGMVPRFDFEIPPIVHFENTNLVWKNCYQPTLIEEVI